MPDDHDVLMNEYLRDLGITGFEAVISEACYSNIVAVLCYSTLRICQNDTNETIQICYNNCVEFNPVIESECPYYVQSSFSQLVSDSNPCESLNNLLSCVSLDDVTPGNKYTCCMVCMYTHYIYRPCSHFRNTISDAFLPVAGCLVTKIILTFLVDTKFRPGAGEWDGEGERDGKLK